MKIERKTMMAIWYVMSNYMNRDQIKLIIETAIDAAYSQPYIISPEGGMSDEAVRHYGNLLKAYTKISKED